MFDNCQRKRAATIGVMCSAVFWSQNNGLQLQNLTIQNTPGDSVDAGNHQAVALRSDGDKVQINNVNILGPPEHLLRDQQRRAEYPSEQPSDAYFGHQQLH